MTASAALSLSIGVHPDPNLVPIVDELVEKKDLNGLCELQSQLSRLSKFDAEGQIEDTVAYVEIETAKMGGCPETSSSGTTATTATTTTTTSLPTSTLHSVNAEAVRRGPMCDDCVMDYDDEATVQFNRRFEEGSQAGSGSNAKQKITTFFVLSGLGIIGVVVVLTVASVFGVRACIKKLKSKKARSDVIPGEFAGNTTFETLNAESGSTSWSEDPPSWPLGRDRTVLYEVKL